MKSLYFVGSSLDDLRNFPAEAVAKLASSFMPYSVGLSRLTGKQ